MMSEGAPLPLLESGNCKFKSFQVIKGLEPSSPISWASTMNIRLLCSEHQLLLQELFFVMNLSHSATVKHWLGMFYGCLKRKQVLGEILSSSCDMN